MGKSLVKKVLDKRNNLNKISLFAIRYSLFAIRYSLFAIRYSLFAIQKHIPIYLIPLFLIPLSTLNAQVIIKEKVEINPQGVISTSGIGGDARNPIYIRHGGSIKIRQTRAVDGSYELWEETLGKITGVGLNGLEVDLGIYPQWQKFIFYIKHISSGQKYYPLSISSATADEGSLLGWLEFHPEYVDGSPFPAERDFVYNLIIEVEYSLAAMPPPEILNADFITNPFQPSEDILIPLPGTLYAVVKKAVTDGDELWIDKPSTELVMDELGYHIYDTLYFGQMSAGDAVRFFIRSPNSVVSGMNLYPVITNQEQIMPDGKILFYSLDFEDWTDLYFDDVRIDVYIKPDSGAYAGPIAVFSNPEQIAPGDTTEITFKNRHLDGTLEEIPGWQRFEVGMIDGCALGKLHTEDGDTNYVYNVTQPIYFIADSSAESGTVLIRAGLVPEISASKPIINDIEQRNKVNTKTARRYDIILDKYKTATGNTNYTNNASQEANLENEFCYTGIYEAQEYGFGDVVVENECDFDNCGDSYDDIIIEVKRQYNFYESGYFETDSLGNRIIKTEIDTVCFRKDSINNVIPDSATGQSRPLKYHRERKNQNGVYEYAWHLKPCKNSSGKIEVRPVLADSVTPTPIYIDFIADVCYTSISNDGYTLITDTTQLSNVVLVPDTAKIIHDLCGHRCYPQLLNKNGFVFKEIVERHELLHMEHFKKILTDTKKDSLVNELKRWVSYTCYDYGRDKKLNSLDGSFDSALREYFSKATRKYWFDYGHTLDAQGNPQIDKTKELAQERKIHYVKGIEDLVKTYHKALSKSRGTIFPDSYNNCTTCP